MRTRCWVYLAVAVAALLNVTVALAAPPKGTRDSPANREEAADHLRCDAQSAWQRVRAVYRIHAQILATCVNRGGSQQVIVLTEPPPHLTRSKADAIVQALLGVRAKVVRQRHNLGYDGWVEDLVMIANLATPADVAALSDGLARLAIYAFGSAYKAEMEDIASMDPAPHWEAPLQLEVTDDDLHAWLLGPNAKGLVGADGDSSTTLKALVDDGTTTGIFQTAEPGLVLAIVPASRTQALNDYSADLRRFAIDIDVFIGAIKLGNRVALIGRERVASFAAAPPLRVESILLLASQRSAQLKQSYERNRPFSGKLLTGAGELFGWDWAPILLSDELIDTEFGSLLNFTDNMLKSWSEGGKVEYKGWTHPKPATFPFGEIGAARSLGTERLTFNWNTAGVGHLSEKGGFQIFSLRNTGSLPVSYFPEDSQQDATTKARLVAAEDKAYEYFRSRRSPMLERAVQYTALYQVFQAFDVHANPPHAAAASKARMSRVEEVLQHYVRKGLTTLARADTPSTDDPLLAATYAQYGNAGKPGLRLADPDAIPRLRREIARDIAALDAEKTPAWRTLYIKSLAIDDQPRLVTREELARIQEERRQLADIEARLGKVARSGWSLALPLEQVRKDVIAAIEHDPEGWIKTPSIVVSRYETRQVIGGHNIGGHATRIEVDAGVRRGNPRVTGNYSSGRIIRVHPGDAPAGRDLVRIFDREVGVRDTPEVVAKGLSAIEARLREPVIVRSARMDMSAVLNQPIAGGGRLGRGGAPTRNAKRTGYDRRRASNADRRKLDALAAGSDAVYAVTRSEGTLYYAIAKVGSNEEMISYAVNLTSARNFLSERAVHGKLPKVVTDIVDLERSLAGVPFTEVSAGGAGGKPPFGTSRPVAAAGDSPRAGGGPSGRLASISVDVKSIPALEREVPASKGGPSAKGEVPPFKGGMPPSKGGPTQSKGGGPPRDGGVPPPDGSGPPSKGGASQPPSGGSSQQGPAARLAIFEERKPKSVLLFEKPGDRAVLQNIKPDWQQANVNIRVRAQNETTFPFAPEMEGRVVHVVDVSVPAKTEGGSVKTMFINALAGFKTILTPAAVDRLRTGVLGIFKGKGDPDMLRALENYKAMMKGEGAEKIKMRVKHEKDIVLGAPDGRVRRRTRG